MRRYDVVFVEPETERAAVEDRMSTSRAEETLSTASDTSVARDWSGIRYKVCRLGYGYGIGEQRLGYMVQLPDLPAE